MVAQHPPRGAVWGEDGGAVAAPAGWRRGLHAGVLVEGLGGSCVEVSLTLTLLPAVSAG